MPRFDSPSRPPRAPALYLIAAFKLINGVLLIAVGIGALSLIHRDLTQLVTHWANVLEVNQENEFLKHVLEKAGLVQTSHLVWVSILTFVYSALMLAMGTGLLLHTLWAEWLTAIVTASFIPVELYELIRDVRPMTILILVINVATVIYLVWRLICRKHQAT